MDTTNANSSPLDNALAEELGKTKSPLNRALDSIRDIAHDLNTATDALIEQLEPVRLLCPQQKGKDEDSVEMPPSLGILISRFAFESCGLKTSFAYASSAAIAYIYETHIELAEVLRKINHLREEVQV